MFIGAAFRVGLEDVPAAPRVRPRAEGPGRAGRSKPVTTMLVHNARRAFEGNSVRTYGVAHKV